VTRINQICASPVDNRLNDVTNSKVLCNVKNLYAVCTDTTSVNDLKSEITLAKNGIWSNSNGIPAQISLSQCVSDANCEDDDPCTIDTCSSEINSYGNTVKCCKHVATSFCETSPVGLGQQSNYPVSKNYFVLLRNNQTLVRDDNTFAKIAKIFDKKSYSSEIHTTSIIPSNTNIGKNVSIGSFVEVGQNSKIGDNSIIMSNTYIGSDVIIGKNVKIYPNVYIESDVIIGNDCIFYPGVRIGTDGFGYARAKDKSWVKIPQTGSVIIGDRVDIGSNSTIDKGAIDNTIIENGVKIDNLVQVGHNCIIGENTIIAGCAGVAGSTKIGKNCMIGGAAMIKGHITIADDTIISGGTGIGKNVENPGKRFTNVFPYNLEHKDWLRIANNIKKMGKKND
jgi:UDP-3-O-[3-hydroxymyristoyl] glucosamine N-acyltransferase